MLSKYCLERLCEYIINVWQINNEPTLTINRQTIHHQVVLVASMAFKPSSVSYCEHQFARV